MDNPTKIGIDNLSLFYGSFQALHGVTLSITERKITAMIGPSGCGKSTLLRCLNRMNDFISGIKIDGKVVIDGLNIYDPSMDLVNLRKKVGMVFQRPNPFPLSVFDNIVYGPKIHHTASKKDHSRIVEESLKAVGLWENLKDQLNESALSLSLEQQQRLCIARLVAVEPDILLMDEPCSSLDPISTSKIEELMQELKNEYTIIIVTHNMQQAARVSDFTAFLYLGKLIEYDHTEKVFTNPTKEETEDYITGRFG